MFRPSSQLFIYGTLLHPTLSTFAQFLQSHGRLLGDAQIKGRLYDVGSYPALIYDPNASNSVKGKLVELLDESLVLDRLDEYEGCHPSQALPHLYLRQLLPLEANGTKLEAWVYVYNRPTASLHWIKSGDYWSYLQEKG